MGFNWTTHLRIIFLLLIAGYLAPGQALAGKTNERQTPAITVLVYNSARVPATDLARAEQEAALLFRRAGVATTWVECSGNNAEICHHPPGSDEFILHIVSSGQTHTDAVFGVAFLGADGSGKYSDIFYKRIEQMHRDSGVSLAQLLGAVAAHEIAHLLLGSNAHSLSGIMAPRWSKGELQRLSMGGLEFTTEQGARMRGRTEDRSPRRANQFARTGIVQ